MMFLFKKKRILINIIFKTIYHKINCAKMLLNLLILVFLHKASCWPDLRLYTRGNPTSAFALNASNFVRYTYFEKKFFYPKF